ncbi:MAG TPA: outer membrane protein transport protein [Verrucomicrobiae bacterium]|nr:outer membrane protein transport protein [Verrucomicrobiae bacterium]
MKKLTHLMVCTTAVTAVAAIGIPQVFALGFKNADQDARATGQGEAFVAQADDASAIYYNPAGLTQLKGTEITQGGMLSFPDSQLKGGGAGAEMNTMAFLPHLYIASDLGAPQSPWRFGLGFNVPYGNAAQFADNGPFRYLITQAKLAVFNIQPTVAYKFNDHLSLGAGVNVYESFTTISQHANASPFPDGDFHFNGDGLAVGGTAGLMWKITPQHTVGLTYRSPFSVNFRGHADLNTVLGHQSTAGDLSIQFPQSIAGGYAFRPIKQLKLETDIEWTNWNTLNSVSLHAPHSTGNGTTTAFNWLDSMFYEFGAQYEVNDHWTVRGGYIYSENTVPNSTFSPTVPDSDRHVFSVGFGYSETRFSIDIVYQYSLSADRTVNSSAARTANGLTAADGAWTSDCHAVMVTSSMRF